MQRGKRPEQASTGIQRLIGPGYVMREKIDVVNDIKVRSVAQWLVLMAGIVFGGAFILGGAVAILGDPSIYNVALDHFAATIGLPSAALAALWIVMFLESTTGRIEFEGLGFRFNGASGPIVLWVVCFLAIVAGIRIAWPLS